MARRHETPPDVCNRCGGPTEEKISRFGNRFMGCKAWRTTGCRGYGGKRAPRGAAFPRKDDAYPVVTTESGARICTPATIQAASGAVIQDAVQPAPVALPAESSTNGHDAGSALWGLVRGPASAEFGAILESRMQGILAAMPERIARIEFVRDGAVIGTVDGHRHEAFAKIANKARMGFRNLMLVGPAGTGKSTLARQLASACGVAYGEMDCTPGTTESHMLGRSVPNIATGQNVYQESEFVKLYQSGGVFCFNESDWLDASIWGCIHEALANGHLFVPASGQTYQRHSDFYIVCTANTYGKGATRQYLRNQLDAATLDRFAGAVVTVDYDESLEKALVGPDVFRAVKAVRDRLTLNASREIWGMRVMLAVARMHANGTALQDAIAECTEGWSEQSKRHAGVL